MFHYKFLSQGPRSTPPCYETPLGVERAHRTPRSSCPFQMKIGPSLGGHPRIGGVSEVVHFALQKDRRTPPFPQSPLSPAVVAEGEIERRTSPKAESPSLALPSAHISPAAGTEMVLRQAESQLGDSRILCPHRQLGNESDPPFSIRNKLTNIATSNHEPPRYRATLRDPQVHPDDERAELCTAMPSFLQGPRASTAEKELALHTIVASPGPISNTT